jgi:hypothetical protein
MADRRTDEASVAPSRSGGKGATGSSSPTGKTEKSATSKDQGSAEETGGRSRGSERFAAAIAKAREGQRSSKTKGTAGAGRPAAAAGRPAVARSPQRRVRRARLRLTHVDPWSVMKTSFLLSIAVGIVMVVAVGIVWSVLGAAGVWDSIDSAVADVAGDTGTAFRIEDYLGTSRVMGITMLLAVVDVFLITVVATLGAFLYNLAAALLGGLEVVFAEEDR